MISCICGDFNQHDVVIISDYKKGVLSAEMLRLIINLAREHQKPIVIDPKPRNCDEYRGATVLTPNLHEFEKIALLSNCPVSDFDTDEDILNAAFWLMKTFDIANILVTRGKDGMSIVSRDGGFTHIPAKSHEVYDVSGAGDTVVATLSLALASGMTHEEAAHLSNTAAGIAVERHGTSVVSQLDLQLADIMTRRVGGVHKIMDIKGAKDRVAQWKRQGRAVGFANGCFDMVHGGHMALLNEARTRCDRLIVAINSDHSVRQLKGNGRPIQQQAERAMILASMSSVDLVVIFNEATPLESIKELLPDFLFKGSDYDALHVVGADIVKKNGGDVIILPRSQMNSTSQLLEKAHKAWTPEIVVNN
jgi:D-beta-D-heptose 7-phosphate kinase/D-beta-D-heptose 1-phosphate adenosyltransferase